MDAEVNRNKEQRLMLMKGMESGAVIHANSKLVKAVARAAATDTDRLHILPRNDKWVLRKDGAERAIGIFNTEREALLQANTTIQAHTKNYVNVFVHDDTGMVKGIFTPDTIKNYLVAFGKPATRVGIKPPAGALKSRALRKDISKKK